MAKRKINFPNFGLSSKQKNTNMKNRAKWIIQASSGLVLTGSGLSLAIDAGITKFPGGDWFYYGTGALIVFQAGLCLLIDSTRHK